MQHLSFCGVFDQQHNGVSERIIKDLTLSLQTLVLNAQHYWSEYITTMLWPFSFVKSADRMNNHHVGMNGKTPEMKFLCTIVSTTWLSNFHTFGCPIYIFDARIQSVVGGVPPKWYPRALLIIYLGHSPSHAGSVALVMNTKSGFVSPQFHSIFDDNFETVPHLRAGTVPENWAKLVASSKENSIEGFSDVTKTLVGGDVYPSAEPRATSNHQTSSLDASQPNGGTTSSGGSLYPISSDSSLVSDLGPSGDPQQIYGSEPKLEVPLTLGMIISDVLPDNGQL